MAIVFSEWSPRLAPSPSTRDLERLDSAVRLLGLHVYPLPAAFTEATGPEQALAYVQTAGEACPAVRVGYRPSLERSTAFYEAAWRDMPTQCHIVNKLAALPIIETRSGRMVSSIGQKDLSDTHPLP